MTRSNPRPTGRRARTSAPCAAGLALAALGGCNGTTSVDVGRSVPGSYTLTPDGQPFFVDANLQGRATEVRLLAVLHGRLVAVDAFDAHGARIRVHDAFLVDPRDESAWDPSDHVLETNPVTGEQTLVIQAVPFGEAPPAGGESGAARFVRLLREAEEGLVPVRDSGFVGAGAYTMVPRNAGIALVFDDLLDPATLHANSLRVLVGDPAVQPFEARVFPDRAHGDLADLDGRPGAEFWPTRVLIDPAVSELDSFRASPPLSVNLSGLPASRDTNLANVQVRIPTRRAQGQVLPVLQNPTGHGLASAGNGSFDPVAPGRDVVRAFRAGGRAEVTADPSNGFLPDRTPPRVVGHQPAVILDPPQEVAGAAMPLTFRLPRVAFPSARCATDPRAGDILTVPPFFAQVTAPATVGGDGVVRDLEVRLVALPDDFSGPAQFEAAGAVPATYRTAYDPALDAGRDPCFVAADPAPADLARPDEDVDPGASFLVRFNEPVDPGSFEPYDDIGLTRKDPRTDTLLATDHVPVTLQHDAALQRFTLRPVLPLAHLLGQTETYVFRVGSGADGPRDLAGNPLEAAPAPVPFRLDAGAPTRATGGRVSLFGAVDEEWPYGDPGGAGAIAQAPREEWFGNVGYDLVRGVVRPRSVVRSRALVSPDPSNAVVSAMVQGPGTSLPLNPLGARTQWLWRTTELDLPLYRNRNVAEGVDIASVDLDVEQLLLSPAGAQAVYEHFPEFQVSLSHAFATPDEVVNAALQLLDPLSGLGGQFGANALDLAEDPPVVVSPRERGYTIEPGDVSLAPNGMALLPLPVNQGVPAAQRRTYTYRDTALHARGGTAAVGVPALRVGQVTGVQPSLPGAGCAVPGAPHPLYASGTGPDVRSAGLPLLVDVRCYPAAGTSSQNLFNHSWAHVVPGSTPQVSSNLPGFRAFSAGGVNQAGATILVDPDAQSSASGGFDPTSTPPGAPLPGVDNVVYHGAADLVTRVSRMHSIFFPAYAAVEGPDATPEDIAGDPTYQDPTYHEPVVVPADQPAGTQVRLSFRATRQIAGIDATGAGTDENGAMETTWATRMDPYGDFYATTPIFFSPPSDDGGVNSSINGASCFDGSYQYLSASANPSIGTAFVGGSAGWTDDLGAISGVEGDWFQVRVTFVSDIATGRYPEISSLGFSWSRD